MKELTYTTIAMLIGQDFDKFDSPNEPIDTYCAYNRVKHIQMATKLVIQRFSNSSCVSVVDVENFIHGLNNIFFNGVAAGSRFALIKERTKG